MVGGNCDIVHNSETVVRMILQELINIRRDFNREIQKLGDRFEKCLSLHPAQPINFTSTVTTKNKTGIGIVSVPDQDNVLSNTIFGSKISDLHSSSLNVEVPDYSEQNPLQDFYKPNILFEAQDSLHVKSLLGNVTKSITNEIDLEVKTKLTKPNMPDQNNLPSIFSLKRSTICLDNVDNDLSRPEIENPVRSERNIFQSRKSNCYFEAEDSRLIKSLSSSRIISPAKKGNFEVKAEVPEDASSVTPSVTMFQAVESLMELPSQKEAPASLSKFAALYFNSNSSFSSIFKTKSNKQNFSKRKRNYVRPSVRNFPCQICHKAFYTSSNLNAHQKTHSGLKPFSCNFCDKLFTRKVALKRHIRLHTGENPFTCEDCGKKFSRRDYLKSHVTKIHLKLLPNLP